MRRMPAQRIGSFGLVAAGVCFAGSAFGQTVISINAQNSRHTINPNVYGVSNITQAQMQDLNSPLVRYGGNNSSRYNWLLNADNRGSDWYFESIGDTSSVAGERGDTFIQTAKLAGAQPMVTIPMLPYVANLGTKRSYLWSFSLQKYGPQTGSDQWYPDAGTGISSLNGHPFITNNNPLDANVVSNATTQLAWIKHIVTKWGTVANGGLNYYILDNEPSIWHSTHRDVHPAGATMSEIYKDYLGYAANIRAVDAGAVIVGPEEWGWTGYLYSGADQQYGATHGWGGPFPDRTANGNMDYMPWFLQQLYKYKQTSGKQLLNVFSLHYYPQQGEFGSDDSAAMQTIRNRSTRSLWDPNYTDTSWINSKVQLIPRMKSWVATYFPGLMTGITEYNWGDDANMNGATTQADIFGIFGREGLDMASRWGTPATNSPTYLAMKMYRNYDGLKNGFGETSVSCTAPNPDSLSAFAAQRTNDSALTVMVINKTTGNLPATINLAGFTSNGVVMVYQVNSATQKSITYLGNGTVTNNSLTTTYPKQSVTLYVFLPQPTGAQYDFESGVQTWTASGKPITSVTSSTTQHFTGTKSLAVNFSGTAGTANASVMAPTTPAGKTVTYHVWIPAGSKIASISCYVLQSALGGWTYTYTQKLISQLNAGAWNTVIVAVPANAKTPLYQLGVQFTTSATWTGTCYVDAVGW